MMFKPLVVFTVLATVASAAAIPPLLEDHKAPAKCPSDRPLSKHPMKGNSTDASTPFDYHPRAKKCNPMGNRPGIDNGIMMPEPGMTIHVGKWFDLQFCSTAYKERKLVSFDVLLVNSTHPRLHHRKVSWANKKQKPIKQRAWAAHYDKLVINETVYDMTTNKYSHNLVSQDIKTIDDYDGPRPGHIQDPPRRALKARSEDNMMGRRGEPDFGITPADFPWKLQKLKELEEEEKKKHSKQGHASSKKSHKHDKDGKKDADKKSKGHKGDDKKSKSHKDEDVKIVGAPDIHFGTPWPLPVDPARRSESDAGFGDDFGTIGTTYPVPEARDGGDDFGEIGTTYPVPEARDGGDDFGVIGTYYPTHEPRRDGGGDFGEIGTTYPVPEPHRPRRDGGGDFGEIGTTYPAPEPRRDGGGDFGEIGTYYPAPEPRRDGGGDFGEIGTYYPAPEAREADEAHAGDDFGVIGTYYPTNEA
ncbi:hypothetical protein BCV69DRAFT_297235 [Microstroma glucosiphilum]|uniref:Uncharacterized protein n=1 Tax=Pseudomicrostroma glucosiphilum TaxID=1684307 RepID=A0A316UH82_9BASI|nr:hypothetical protein BCV69DRAFT_297235 [Pseudomicrostroma glucosiphilum]PWN23293.1 hypothetical protein BCV69DRAFT_297235 [Pseudomicrostroma glucosiphilum]